MSRESVRRAFNRRTAANPAEDAAHLQQPGNSSAATGFRTGEGRGRSDIVPVEAASRLAAARLLELLDDCCSAEVTRRAVLLRLSSLPPELARPQHLRLARAALDPLCMADRAAAFRLPSEDVVVIWKGGADDALAHARNVVEHLFGDEDSRVDTDELLLLLDLPEHADLLRRVIEAQLAPHSSAPSRSTAGLPLDPASLLVFERALVQADVTSFIRRKQICTVGGDGRFLLAWEKRFISVAQLSAALLPERSAQADPWLFRRLTRTLDRRMLSLLASADELRGAGPFSLNLNVSTILSPEFLRFDSALPIELRGRVTLDLLPTDVLADCAAFLFARDFARARGYRLSLRGLTPELLAVFPRGRIGVDMIQLRWSPALASIDVSGLFQDGPHTVLTRCDRGEAVAWGQACAIRHFQGQAVLPAATAPVSPGAVYRAHGPGRDRAGRH